MYFIFLVGNIVLNFNKKKDFLHIDYRKRALLKKKIQHICIFKSAIFQKPSSYFLKKSNTL